MIEKREFNTLGHANHGWLNARHHFSFGGYHDPARMGWGALRVWNDDEIAAGRGFAPHPHRDMEIITYVIKGAISHKDDKGNGRTSAGNVQVMSAGNGITHSEHNREKEDTHLFQIWIMPRENGGEPRWESREFPTEELSNQEGGGQLSVLASGYDDDITNGALMIRADGRLLAAHIKAGVSIAHQPKKGHKSYLVVAKGQITINGVTMNERDGAAIKDEDALNIMAEQESDILLVETL